MIEPTARNSSRSPRRRKVLVFFVVGLLVTATPTIVAGFGDIIFDPANFAKNVQQVVALLRQIEQASEQIRQHRLMLEHLRASVAEALRQVRQRPRRPPTRSEMSLPATPDLRVLCVYSLS